MRNAFFPRLAADNLRKNSQTYLPYLVTCTVTVMMHYIITSLAHNPDLGHDALKSLLLMGESVSALFAMIFLFYTNSFLIKRRKKEFGLYQTLGMEKRHLAQSLAWEFLYITGIAVGGGMLLGIALDKLMFLLITRLMGDEVSLGFFISPEVLWHCATFFLLIFAALYLHAVFQLRSSSPLSLMQDARAGEREPKAKWLLALIGFLCIGAGYYYACTVKNVFNVMGTFFGAVALVIIGTYLIFTAGSIAILKLLKQNKHFYYQPRHFVGVSGLVYRMKQNAVGLANICILSTMVLVMISSTASLLFGMESALSSRHPNDFVFNLRNEDTVSQQQLIQQVQTLAQQEQLPITQEVSYRYGLFSVSYQDDLFQPDRDNAFTPGVLLTMPVSDFNTSMETDYHLAAGEAMVYSTRFDYAFPTLTLMDKTYTVKENLEQVPGNNFISMNIADGFYLVLPDEEFFSVLAQAQKTIPSIEDACRFFYGFDSSANTDEQLQFHASLCQLRKDLQLSTHDLDLESRAESRTSFLEMYGGCFFIGVFLGILFLMATVLIIYYKQITEGLDDRSRYTILRQVGMSQKEIKSAIHSQILTVFFLPLAIAGLHVIAAFPLMTKLLAILNLTDVRLFAGCTAVCYLVFSLFYFIVYSLTAKTYYKIVSK